MFVILFRFCGSEPVQTQKCISFVGKCALGAVADAPAVPDDDGGLFSPGDGCIKQVAVVHEGLRFVDDGDDALAFGALHLVDCAGESERDVLHVVRLERLNAVVEFDVARAVAAGGDAPDAPHGAVHHVQLVVVPVLDDLVVDIQARSSAGPDGLDIEPEAFLLNQPLKLDVEVVHAEDALLHRREKLHIPAEVKAELFLQHVLVQIENEIENVIGPLELVHHIPFLASGRALDVRRNAPGQNGDAVFLQDARLPHYLRKNGRRDNLPLNEVAQNVAGPHRRQLIVVAHQNEVGPLKINRLKQPPTERHVQHGDFVENENVRFDGIVRPAMENMAVVTEQSVNGGCLHVRGLFHAFCRLACWRGERDGQIGVAIDIDDARDGVSLARARAPGDQAHGVLNRGDRGGPLSGVQAVGDNRGGAFCVELCVRTRVVCERLRDALLHLINGLESDKELVFVRMADKAVGFVEHRV